MSESIESSSSLPDADNGSNSSPSPDYSFFPSPPDAKSPPNVGGSGNSKSPPPKGSGSSSKNAPPPLDDSSSSSNSSSSLSPPPSPPPKSDSPPTSNSNNLMKTYPFPPPSNSYNSMKTSSSPPPTKSPQIPPSKSPQIPPLQNPPPPSKTLQSPPPPQNLPPPSMTLQSPPPPSSPPPHPPSTSLPPSSSSTIPAAEGLKNIPHPPAVSKSTPSPIITPPGIPPINKVSPPTDGSSSPADSGLSHASPSKENAYNTPSLRPSGNSNSKSRGSSSGSSSSPSTPDSSSTTNGQTGTIVGVTVAGVFLIALVAMIFVVMRRKKRAEGYYPNGHVRNQSYKNSADGYTGGQPRQSSNGSDHGSQRYHAGGGSDSGVIGGPNPHFTYEEMVEITNGFSRQNILGEGGFGCVFKGWLADGREVAVKKLKAGGGQGEREFKAEVEIISRVHHRYLVSLVGYCISENHRLLIYEFVSNKTLEYHLHSNEAEVLDWPKRLKIALGAAKGLAYLHEDCHPKIIHRDIKSANILLDTAYEAKVADFGLAKLSSDTKTHVSTRVMGTFGYMAPEYASSGKLTDRSDVFSFGVVLLELVTGRKPVDPSQPLGDESLVEWARPFLIHALQTGDVSELVDPRLQKHYVESEIIRMIEAAAACVRHSATKRPRMMQVVRALDCEGEYSDLSNGVKYGQSTIYDSDQYNQEIIRFRKMAVDSKETSEYDAYNGEYSREFSGSQNPGKSTPSSELDSQNIGSGHHTIFRL